MTTAEAPTSGNKQLDEELLKKLADHGEFKMIDDKTLEYAAYSFLKMSFVEVMVRATKKARDAIVKKRIAAFKSKNQQEYVVAVREDKRLVINTLALTTMMGCKSIGVTEEVWVNSGKLHYEDARKATEMRIKETELRKGFINQNVTIDEETTMKALKFKIIKDFEFKEKVMLLQARIAPEHLPEVREVEVYKIHDHLRAEFGVDIDELEIARQHYQIDPGCAQLREHVQRTS
jgi:hypothetical protein